nr:CSC1-like protein At3g54510 [Ipomoea batatas]
MNAESLLVSAAINIGLAIFILSLFSILKNQPFYASIYYARRLHLRQNPFASPTPSALHRLLPSLDWIRRAVRVSEDEILETHGLDVLVFIRFFKFGINFFVVCSLIGMVVLLPLNYTGSSVRPKSYYSMDAFAISNISSGSNRIQQLRNKRQYPNQFTILVRRIPFCQEHKVRGCCIDHFFTKHHPYSYQSYQILYDGKELENLVNKAKSAAKRIEDLKVKQSTNKRNGKSFLSGACRKKDKIEKLEQMLEELHSKIRHPMVLSICLTLTPWIFGVSYLHMPPRQKKKSVAQRQPPAEQLPDTQFHDPINFERFQFFSTRQVFRPYVLSLDVAEAFEIREEVAAMVALPEWRYLLIDFNEDTYKSVLVEVMTTLKLPKFDGLTSTACIQFHIGHTMFRFSPDELSDLMGFGPVQQLTEEEKLDRVANVPNIQQFWAELTGGTSVFRSSHSRSSAFIKKEHKFMQYQLGHSITGRFDATSSVNHADLFCLYGMVKGVRLHMGVVLWNLFKNQYYMRGTAMYLGPYLTRILRVTQRIVLAEPRSAGMQPLTADAVARMRDKIGPKRARTEDMPDVANARREEEGYEAYPDAAGPAHAGGQLSQLQEIIIATPLRKPKTFIIYKMRFERFQSFNDHPARRLGEVRLVRASPATCIHYSATKRRGGYSGEVSAICDSDDL